MSMSTRKVPIVRNSGIPIDLQVMISLGYQSIASGRAWGATCECRRKRDPKLVVIDRLPCDEFGVPKELVGEERLKRFRKSVSMWAVDKPDGPIATMDYVGIPNVIDSEAETVTVRFCEGIASTNGYALVG